MGTVREAVSIDVQIELVAACHTPAHIARVFAQHALQVPRVDYVRLARQLDARYRAQSARQAARFRSRLDELLRQRDEPPITWAD